MSVPCVDSMYITMGDVPWAVLADTIGVPGTAMVGGAHDEGIFTGGWQVGGVTYRMLNSPVKMTPLHVR